MKALILVTAGFTLVTGTAWAQQQAGQAQSPGQQVAGIETQQKQPLGEYLTDAEGRALYMFTADTKGEASDCYDACAQAWPPALATQTPELAEPVKEDMVGMLARKDGSQQITYNGWPLYYYVQDTAAGQVAGQDKQGFGGEWYVVSPEGEAIKKTEQGAQTPR